MLEAFPEDLQQEFRDVIAAAGLGEELGDYGRAHHWRTARGFTATFEAMLTQPLALHYYDEVFQGDGVAARNH